MDTKTIAAALIGFMLGGLVVAVAAEAEPHDPQPSHGSISLNDAP